MTLKVLHDIQIFVGLLWLFRKLQLDRVRVAERIAHVERSLTSALLLRTSSGRHLHLPIHRPDSD